MNGPGPVSEYNYCYYTVIIVQCVFGSAKLGLFNIVAAPRPEPLVLIADGHLEDREMGGAFTPDDPVNKQIALGLNNGL